MTVEERRQCIKDRHQLLWRRGWRCLGILTCRGAGGKASAPVQSAGSRGRRSDTGVLGRARGSRCPGCPPSSWTPPPRASPPAAPARCSRARSHTSRLCSCWWCCPRWRSRRRRHPAGWGCGRPYWSPAGLDRRNRCRVCTVPATCKQRAHLVSVEKVSRTETSGVKRVSPELYKDLQMLACRTDGRPHWGEGWRMRKNIKQRAGCRHHHAWSFPPRQHQTLPCVTRFKPSSVSFLSEDLMLFLYTYKNIYLLSER